MNNRDTQTAWEYHNQTKHSSWSVRSSPHYLDWESQPIPFKIYEDLEPVPLPREWKEIDTPTLSAISAFEVEFRKERIPTLEDLSRLLYLSAGMTRRKSYPGGEIFFRAASCTGALYEIEFYIVCADLDGLPAGVYHFNPADFALRRLRQGDYRPALAHATAGEPAVADAPLTIVSTGTYWRNAWKYRSRTYRHFGWDNGTMLANLLAAAAALDFPARVVLGFIDDELNRLLDLDTFREVTLALIPIGRTEKKMPEQHPAVEPLGLKVMPQRNEVDYPAMREIHESSVLTSPEEVGGWRGAAAELSIPSRRGRLYKLEPHADGKMPGDSIQQVVRRRGSSRHFERTAIGFSEFSTMLYCSGQGVPADFLENSGVSLNHWYVIVHEVNNLPAGSYYLHRDTWELELLQEGNFRGEAGHLGLDQELPADASADVFFLADLDSILRRFGNRGYRAVQLEAGILGGKLYLSAYAQRLGATGLTFYDDEVVEFFSPHAQGKSTIFLMALGRGKRRSLLSIDR